MQQVWGFHFDRTQCYSLITAGYLILSRTVLSDALFKTNSPAMILKISLSPQNIYWDPLIPPWHQVCFNVVVSVFERAALSHGQISEKMFVCTVGICFCLLDASPTESKCLSACFDYVNSIGLKSVFLSQIESVSCWYMAVNEGTLNLNLSFKSVCGN